jgi:hypothetical protein
MHTVLKDIGPDPLVDADPRGLELRKIAIGVAALLPNDPDEADRVLRYASRIIDDFYR